MAEQADYSSWSNEQLVARVTELERRLRHRSVAGREHHPPTPFGSSKKRRTARAFDSTKYSTRLIALKLAYFGQNYNGFEYHVNNTTPLPTVEEVLWKALTKTKLIAPAPARDRHGRAMRETEVNWEGCEYSKCGRTDKGVSAFGQVIGIRVRSNRPRPQGQTEVTPATEMGTETAHNQNSHQGDEMARSKTLTSNEGQAVKALNREDDPDTPFDDIRDEFSYIQMLNGVLPDDVRILAWCPTLPTDFSARFSCRGRQYRYFFTQPAFLPFQGPGGLYTDVSGRTRREGWLDIEAMREAAQHLVGEHDFRNFCKLEAARQITNFKRRILEVAVDEVDTMTFPKSVAQGQVGDAAELGQRRTSIGNVPFTDSENMKLYCFRIHGSAFLWHQVRNLAAVLFLVGQGFESPSVIPDLLDVVETPSRPKYDMASDVPLVLWDCTFPEEGGDPRKDGLDWVYAGDPRLPSNSKLIAAGTGDGKYGRKGIMEDLWEQWRRTKLSETLAASLLDVVARHPHEQAWCDDRGSDVIGTKNPRVFLGDENAKPGGMYVPIMSRDRMESIEVLNANWAERNGMKKGHVVVEEDEVDE